MCCVLCCASYETEGMSGSLVSFLTGSSWARSICLRRQIPLGDDAFPRDVAWSLNFFELIIMYYPSLAWLALRSSGVTR